MLILVYKTYICPNAYSTFLTKLHYFYGFGILLMSLKSAVLKAEVPVRVQEMCDKMCVSFASLLLRSAFNVVFAPVYAITWLVLGAWLDRFLKIVKLRNHRYNI
jgi:hypothetical protein